MTLATKAETKAATKEVNRAGDTNRRYSPYRMKPTEDVIKRTFFPYGRGHRPVYRLVMWDTYERTRYDGRSIIGYQLVQDQRLLFQGTDFYPPNHIAWDNNACIVALMDFLTLKPGDTDKEYFDRYNIEQMDFAQAHADSLYCEVHERLDPDFNNS